MQILSGSMGHEIWPQYMVYLQAIASHLPHTPMMVYGSGRWAHFNVKLHFKKSIIDAILQFHILIVHVFLIG